MVEPIRDLAEILGVGGFRVHSVENLVAAICRNVMNLSRLSAQVGGSHDCVCFDPAAIPDLMRLALLPVLAFKGQVGRQRILISEIDQLDQLISQLFAASLVTSRMPEVIHAPAAEPAGFHPRAPETIERETGD